MPILSKIRTMGIIHPVRGLRSANAGWLNMRKNQAVNSLVFSAIRIGVNFTALDIFDFQFRVFLLQNIGDVHHTVPLGSDVP